MRSSASTTSSYLSWASKLQPMSYRNPSRNARSTSRRKHFVRERAQNIVQIVSHSKTTSHKMLIFLHFGRAYQLLAYAMLAYHHYETYVSLVRKHFLPFLSFFAFQLSEQPTNGVMSKTMTGQNILLTVSSLIYFLPADDLICLCSFYRFRFQRTGWSYIPVFVL